MSDVDEAQVTEAFSLGLPEGTFNGMGYAWEAEDTDGWVSYCPDFDVMTMGDSPDHALDMLAEAVTMVIQDDIRHGRDPHRRSVLEGDAD